MAGNISRYRPFSEMTRFDPFRSMDDLFRELSMLPTMGGNAEPQIRMDVSETEQAYMVKAEIPGVKKEDIKIGIDGNRVSIQAEIKQEKDVQQGGNLVRSERSYGQAYRSFTLPQDVDDEKAEAKYQDGVLSLTLPKKSGGGSKQLTVQ